MLLLETIHSVIMQEYTNWEIIIVDDGSDINEYNAILEIKDSDERIKIFKKKSNKKGPSICRNEAVEYAMGNYLIFLDSDDILATFCIKRRMELMLKSPLLDIGVFKIEKFYKYPGDSGQLFSLYAANRNEYLKMFLSLNIPWQVMAPIWKKETFTMLGGFNEDMDYAEDPELHARALLNDSIKINFFSQFTSDCFYRIGSFQNSSTNIQKSINGRIHFLIILHQHIIANTNLNKYLKKIFFKSLKHGFKNTFIHFLNDSGDMFPEKFKQLSNYFIKHRLISFPHYWFSKILYNLWETPTTINKFIPIKGLLTKIYINIK